MPWNKKMRMTEDMVITIMEHADLDNETLRFMVNDQHGELFSVTTIAKVKRYEYDVPLTMNAREYDVRIGQSPRGRSTSSSRSKTHRESYQSSTWKDQSSHNNGYTPPQSKSIDAPVWEVPTEKYSSSQDEPIFSPDTDDDRDYHRSYGGGGFSGFSGFDFGDLSFAIGRKALPILLVLGVLALVGKLGGSLFIGMMDSEGLFGEFADWLFVQYWVLRLVYATTMANVAKVLGVVAVAAFAWGHFVDDYLPVLYVPAKGVAMVLLLLGASLFLFAYFDLVYAVFALLIAVGLGLKLWFL